MKIAVGTLILLAVFSVSGVAQEYTRWGLPEGAKMRLGKGRIYEIRYSADGTRLAVASSIGIWLYDTATYEEVALIAGHAHAVYSVAFSSGGSELSSWNSDRTVRRWDIKTRSHLRGFSVHISQYGIGVLSADGNIFACRSYGAVELWDVQTGELMHTLSDLGRSLESMALKSDGSLLACGNSVGKVHVWDVKAGTERHTLTGHTGSVTCVAFSPDGRTLASRGSDGTVRLWNTKTGERLSPSIKTDYVVSSTFNPESDMLAIGLLSHEVELWKLKEM